MVANPKTLGVCQFCDGIGFESVPGGVKVCRHRTQNGGSRDPMNPASFGIPERYRDASFESFEAISPSQMRALNVATKYANEFPRRGGLLLTGPYGVGKTHLVTAILKAVSQSGKKCRFYVVDSLLNDVKHSFKTESGVSEQHLMYTVYNADLVVLDDLGATNPSIWVLEMLSQIIGARYNRCLPTIFTSNFSDVAHSGKTLADRVSGRIRSRLYEMCVHLEIDGCDYRQQSSRSESVYIEGGNSNV